MSHPALLSADRLASLCPTAPRLAVVLGSGAGPVAHELTDLEVVASYGDLGLPQTGVEGHSGEVRVGQLGHTRVALFCGRIHPYEGWTGEELCRGVRAAAAWGVDTLLSTCAVGSLRKEWPAGSLVRVTDHINFSGINPLQGKTATWPGPRFPDLSGAYGGPFAEALDEAAKAAGVPLPQGVYAAMPGPSYETPAEVRMLRVLGADLAGMSLVAESIAGAHAGLTVGSVCVVSNLAAGLATTPLTHEEVTVEVGRASRDLTAVLSALRLPAR